MLPVFLSAVNLLLSFFNLFMCLFHFGSYKFTHCNESANGDVAYNDSNDLNNQDNMD